jgi:hypothetical protein
MKQPFAEASIVGRASRSGRDGFPIFLGGLPTNNAHEYIRIALERRGRAIYLDIRLFVIVDGCEKPTSSGITVSPSSIGRLRTLSRSAETLVRQFGLLGESE